MFKLNPFSVHRTGFAMTVTYMTRGFEIDYKALSKQDALENENREGSQF